jgi:hypothetical protein
VRSEGFYVNEKSTDTTWDRFRFVAQHFNHCATAVPDNSVVIQFINQLNAYIISHKTLLKHSDMFRSCLIIIRKLCSLLKLCYSIHNSIRICKRGVAAYRVVWECVVEQMARCVRTKPSSGCLQENLRSYYIHCARTWCRDLYR